MADYLDEILAEAGVSPKGGETQTPLKFAEQTTQRENLRVLAVSGQTKEYLGKAMSLGDIEKLSEKNVQQFHTRYEAVLAQKMHKTAVYGVLRVAVKVLEFVLPYGGLRLRNASALLAALQNDELVTMELSAVSTHYIANNRLSPFIALASAALTAGTHVESADEHPTEREHRIEEVPPPSNMHKDE
ncbi:hypothetical protein QZH41_004237 [Actinostola sp. cb2023]|nr:hypothetical protein QZH41_004237 [Actinostola sp. cb2023]